MPSDSSAVSEPHRRSRAGRLATLVFLFLGGAAVAASALADNACFGGFNSAQVSPDPNFGFPNGSTPGPGLALTGYPELEGQYTTGNLILTAQTDEFTHLSTIFGDISKVSETPLLSQQGVIIEYTGDFRVVSTYSPSFSDPGVSGFDTVEATIDFTMVWEYIVTGTNPGWHGRMYRPNSTRFEGRSCQFFENSFNVPCNENWFRDGQALRLCHNTEATRRLTSGVASPRTLELMVDFAFNFGTRGRPGRPPTLTGLRVGADQLIVGDGDIQLNIGSNSPLALPPGEPAVRNAQVTLLRQIAPITARRNGETDAQYLERIEAATLPATAIERGMSRLDEGVVRFEGLDTLVLSQNGADVVPQLTPVYYSAIVRAGRTFELDLDTTDPDDTVETVFLSGFATNIQPGTAGPTLQSVALSAADGIGRKANLADSLALLAPTNFAPIETGPGGVREHLDDLLAGSPVDTQLEGVNRAFWGELAARDAMRHADPLLSAGLGSLGDLVNRLLDEILGEAEGTPATKQQDRQRRNAADADVLAGVQADGWPGTGGLTVAQVRAKLKEIRQTPMGELLKAALDEIKWVLGQGLGLVRQWLTEDGFGGPALEIFLAGAQDALIAALEEMINNGATSFDTFRPFIISNAINLQKGVLLDGDVPFSAGALLAGPPPGQANPDDEGTLRPSLDRMKAWDAADRAAYRQDRDNAANLINILNTDASTTLTNLGYGAVAVQTLDNVAFLSGAVSSIFPKAKVVEKLAQITGTLGNAALVVAPLWAGYRVIEAADGASDLAFGQLPSGLRGAGAGGAKAKVLEATGPLPDNLTERLEALGAALATLDAALGGNDPSAGLDALSSESGLDGALAACRDEARVVFAQANLGQFGSSEPVDALGDLQRSHGAVTAGVAALISRGEQLWTEVLTRRFTGPDDPWYQVRRNDLRADIARLDTLVTDYSDEVQAFLAGNGGVTFPSLVQIGRVRAVSESTGLDGYSGDGERFTVTAEVVNASLTPVSDVALELMTVGEGVTVTTVSSALQAVGNLAANDGDPDAGGDRATVSWTIEFLGTATAGTLVPLGLTVLEGGSEPVNFLAGDAQFLLGPDRRAMDADGDGLALHYETTHGLDPESDDAALDRDGDGLDNFREQQLRTSASDSDSDGDGLADGEEVVPGVDGVRSDPLDSDTDRDGVPDGSDPAPIDPLVPAPANRVVAVGATVAKTEPEVVVDTNALTLGGEDFLFLEDYVAEIAVSNGGGGQLDWYVEPLIPGLLYVTPDPGQRTLGAGTVRVALKTGYSAAQALRVPLRIVDASGSVPDEQIVFVKIGTPEPLAYQVEVRVLGGGRVRSADARINCGAVCAATYDMGSSLSLDAVPNPGYRLRGWEGSPECGTTAPVSGNVTCTARFEAVSALFRDGFESF